MSDNNETYGILSPEKNSFNEFIAPTLPPIANFWRRIFALLLDYLIIGFTGLIISLPFSFLLYKIGPYGRLFGFLIILPYFGIMNSKICNGQTLGKRILKIAVRNKENRYISVPLSFARIAILLIPNIFSISFGITLLDGFISTISTGVGLAIVLLYIFNKKNRQSVHDMIIGTYVVHLVDKRVYEYPKTEKKFWVLSAASIIFAGILILGSTTIFSNIITRNNTVINLYEKNTIPQDVFFSIGFSEKTTYHGNDIQTKTLLIDCWYKGKITNKIADELATSIAYAMINDEQIDLDKYDYLGINIYSKYDIGIANSHFNISKTMPVGAWKDVVLDMRPSGDL